MTGEGRNNGLQSGSQKTGRDTNNNEIDILWVVGPALGHVARTAVIARELRNRFSIKSIFIGADLKNYHKEVNGQEFDLVKLPNGRAHLLEYSVQANEVVKKFNPKVICIDGNPIPWAAGLDYSNVRTVYVTNFFLTSASPYKTWQDDTYEHKYETIQKLRSKLNLPEISSARDLYETDIVLLADPPQLVPHEFKLKPNYRLVGPCTWQPQMMLPEDLKFDNRTLFFSLGSTGTYPLPKSLCEEIISCVGAQQVIVVGDNCPDISGVPIRHYKRLPGMEIAKKSVLTITQGGTGSSYQALCAGSPLACWPNHANHTILGRYIEQAGLGVLLEHQNWESSLVRLHERFANMSEHAKRIANEYCDDGPYLAANEIAALINE